MVNLISDIPQRKAVIILRILYPIWAIVGLFGIMYVPSALIVADDAATTATNIMDNELLFRAGIVSSLITQLLFILVVLVLYKLFKSVNKNHASLMVAFALVSVPIAMFNSLNQVAALLLLNGADYLKALGTGQLNSQMMFFLNLNDQGVIVASIFWGLWLFPLGYLTYKSGYLPKIFGVFLIIGGFGYLLGSFTELLIPDYEAILSLFEIMTFGEMLFIFWLVIMGAKIPESNS